jgi:hypothetical protein
VKLFILEEIREERKRDQHPKPCKSCPWRRSSNQADIPGFDRAQACHLKTTCAPNSQKVMACHASPKSRPSLCHGFAQSATAQDHIGLRLASAMHLAQGAQPSRPDCFDTYDEMAAHHEWFDEEEDA